MESKNNFCFVGLGNPGQKYEQTRHNAGFLFLDFLASSWGLSWEKKAHYHLAKKYLFNSSLFFLKPMQFMNLSGFAVKEITSYYRIPNSNLLICYDDLAFPVGDYRLKPKGSAGGHNGLASIIEKMGTQEIPRFRFGIASVQKTTGVLKDFVLSRFSQDEMKILENVFTDGEKILQSFVEKGLDKTMSLANYR